MASAQDTSSAGLHNVAYQHTDLLALKCATSERAEQISQHLDGIVSMHMIDSLQNRKYMYEALLEVDAVMKKLEELEQRIAERCE